MDRQAMNAHGIMPQAIQAISDNLRAVALYSPKLAYMLTRGMPLQLRHRSMTITWNDTAIDQLSPGTLFSEKLFQLFWIWDMVYTIRRPLANQGVFGKLEQDYYATQSPFIDVRVEMTGREYWDVSEGFQPIETIMSTSPTMSRAPAAWILQQDSNVRVTALNRRTFNQDELPFNLTITFIGLELSGCELPNCGFDESVCTLREQGILPKDYRCDVSR